MIQKKVVKLATKVQAAAIKLQDRATNAYRLNWIVAIKFDPAQKYIASRKYIDPNILV